MNAFKNLETPCIVIDMEQTKRNIDKMQKEAEGYHCKLRPHIKTHKSIEFAKLQIKAGAAGITCAKLSEAEVMANAGIDDIFIAYPLIGATKLERAALLHKKIKRLILAVDSEECADEMSKIALQNQIVFEIRMEVDTGAKRTGVTRDRVIKLARYIKTLKNLDLTGIYTFKSLFYKNAPTTSNELAGQEEGQLMNQIYLELKENGIEISDISAGSTPTGLTCAKTGFVTEIRPGTYIFYDQMTYMEKACSINEISAFIYATVVSTPTDDYAILDGGTKTFPADVQLNVEPFFFKGYAYVCGRDDLILSRLNEEHGILTSTNGKTNLAVGDVLKLIPTHICTSVNLQNNVYVYEEGELRQVHVDARGMLY